MIIRSISDERRGKLAKNINIIFKVEGGTSIGLGHIVRCCSLARKFRSIGCKVFFLSKFIESVDWLKGEEFEVIVLDDRLLFVEEIEKISKVVQEYKCELLIIDSYEVTNEYLEKIRRVTKKLAYIDDLNNMVYSVDILINGNINAQNLKYKKNSTDELMLLGPKFNLIREEFREVPERGIRREVEAIMITTGGTDPYDINGKIVNIISKSKELSKVKINIIVGKAFYNISSLRGLAKTNKNIILHENVEQMSEIMLTSDIAISSGGSTLYELCACGTPTLSFIMAENQISIVEMMDKSGYVESLGWYDTVTSDILLQRLNNLCHDYSKRVLLSKKMQTLVDGKGTERVVECVMQLFI